MAKRSIAATVAGIRKAKQVFHRTGWTQSEFAMEVGLATRQPIWKFFSGRPIDRAVFVDICFRLDLEWEEIAGIGQYALAQHAAVVAETSPESTPEKTSLLEQVRTYLREQDQGQLQWMPFSLDLLHPLPLDAAYVPQQLWTTPRHLRQFSSEALDSTSAVTQKGQASLPTLFAPGLVPGPNWERINLIDKVQQQPKLILQGQVGAGKTTALRALRQFCLQQTVFADKVPLLLQLSGEDFLTQVKQQWHRHGLPPDQLLVLLKGGHLLVLIDGFDDLGASERCFMRTELEQWCQAYPYNALVVSCRPNCDEAQFYDFAIAELATLDASQIEVYAQRWFAAVETTEQLATRPSPVAPPLDLLSEGQWANRSATAVDQSQRFLAAWQRLSWPDGGVTPLALHGIAVLFRKQQHLGMDPGAIAQTLLDLLLFRWERISGRGQCSTESPQELLDALGHLAMGRMTRPHRPFGVAQLAQARRGALIPDPGMGAEWVSSQRILHQLYRDYGLLEEVGSEQYQMPHGLLQVYLCALQFSVRSEPTAELPALISILMSLPFELSLSWMTMLLSLSAQPNALAQMLFQHWQRELGLGATPEWAELQHWLSRKAEYCPGSNSDFAQAFYYCLTQAEAVELLSKHILNQAITLPEPLAQDLWIQQGLNQLYQLQCCAQEDQFLACKRSFERGNAQEVLALFPDLHGRGEPSASAGPRPSESDRWQAWWNTQGSGFCQAVLNTCQTTYDLRPAAPGAEMQVNQQSTGDRVLLRLMLALIQTPAILRQVMLPPVISPLAYPPLQAQLIDAESRLPRVVRTSQFIAA